MLQLAKLTEGVTMSENIDDVTFSKEGKGDLEKVGGAQPLKVPDKPPVRKDPPTLTPGSQSASPSNQDSARRTDRED